MKITLRIAVPKNWRWLGRSNARVSRNHAITQKLRHLGLAFDWLSLTFIAHWPMRILALSLLFALNYLFSVFLESWIFLANQNGVIFPCVLLVPKAVARKTENFQGCKSSAGNNSRSSDIVRPNFENVRPISHYDRTWWPNISPAHLELSSTRRCQSMFYVRPNLSNVRPKGRFERTYLLWIKKNYFQHCKRDRNHGINEINLNNSIFSLTFVI